MTSPLQDMAAILGIRKGYHLIRLNPNSQMNRVEAQCIRKTLCVWVNSTTPDILERFLKNLPPAAASLPVWILFCLRCGVELSIHDRSGRTIKLIEPAGGTTMMLYTSVRGERYFRVSPLSLVRYGLEFISPVEEPPYLHGIVSFDVHPYEGWKLVTFSDGESRFTDIEIGHAQRMLEYVS